MVMAMTDGLQRLVANDLEGATRCFESALAAGVPEEHQLQVAYCYALALSGLDRNREAAEQMKAALSAGVASASRQTNLPSEEILAQADRVLGLHIIQLEAADPEAAIAEGRAMLSQTPELGGVAWALGNAIAGKASAEEDPNASIRLIEDAAKVWGDGLRYMPEGLRDQTAEKLSRLRTTGVSSGCVVATACGPGDPRVAALRQARDCIIQQDPVARDFFHVFWSRYYEWSPSVARIAAQDRSVASHVKWGFLEPWLTWMELAAVIGSRRRQELSGDDTERILRLITNRMERWIRQVPDQMEAKRPVDNATVMEAVERFRVLVQSRLGDT